MILGTAFRSASPRNSCSVPSWWKSNEIGSPAAAISRRQAWL
ncbi:Uncharacterised protein [Bordetella pertussis]|nr:Uncharacterised protein [Bordetella pertussis]